ncbi:MAG: hypothetical protein RJQ04_07775 [Longimicrobiales bacterium]
MSGWLARLRGALGMGVTWGVTWGLVGVMIGVSLLLGLPMGWFIEVFDAPLPALAVPGFVCGAAFSIVLGVAGRRRRFDELSLPRFTLWGAAGGLLVSLLPLSAVAEGAAFTVTEVAIVLGTLTVLSAGSAAGTLAVARWGEDRALLEASDDVGEVGLSEEEARRLLGG